MKMSDYYKPTEFYLGIDNISFKNNMKNMYINWQAIPSWHYRNVIDHKPVT